VPIQQQIWTRGQDAPIDVPTYQTFNENSPVITAASSVLIPAQTAPFGFWIYNPVGNDPIQINLAGGDAAVSYILLEAGKSFTYQPTESWLLNGSITAAGTAGDIVHVFTAVETF
jgi:hypothetical protein